MTDEAKALVEQAAEAIRRRAVETCDADESEQWFAMQFAQAALAGTGVLERLETQAREIERLREALALKDQYFKGITKLAALGEQ